MKKLPRLSKKNNEIPQNKEETLSTEQLEMTLKMADYFDSYISGYKTQSHSPFGGYYTPSGVNYLMQSLNNNPTIPLKIEDIENALKNPKSSEQILRNYATYFEINNMFYKRLINYNTNLPSWNLTFDCPTATLEDMNSEKFKDDLKTIDNFMGRYNSKAQNSSILKQILRQGVYFGVLRDEGTIYSFQELPPDFCKIVGKSTIGSLFNIDFSYFNNPSVDINTYPKIFKTLYREIYKQAGQNYTPTKKTKKRHSSFNHEIDVSPIDNFFCFKLDDTITTLVPYYSALFPDIFIQPIMRNLEKDKAMIAANKLLVGILETYDKGKNSTVTNQLAMQPNDVGKFISVAREAVNKCIGLTMMPVKNTEIVDFNVEAQNRYISSSKMIASNSSSSSAPLLSEEKLNAFESELAATIDGNFVKSFYFQFENFLNYYVNKTTNYRFTFTYNDVNTSGDSEKRLELFKTLSSMGLVDINLYARVLNKNVFEATRGLQMSKIMNLTDNLTQLQSLNNQSAEAGRPSDNSSLNDNTLTSKEQTSNELAQV